MSSGHSVEFQVHRRASGQVPSSIPLDHGDVLVMGCQPNRSMNIDCTASGLQGPRVNVTFRWVTQHAASCPLAGVVGCVLPTCAQGVVEPGSRGLGMGENKWSSSWGLVLLVFILVSVLLFSTWIYIRREHRHSGQRPSRSAAYFSSRGPLGWGRALATVTTSPISLESVFLFLFFIFLGEQSLLFFYGYDFVFCCTAEYASS